MVAALLVCLAAAAPRPAAAAGRRRLEQAKAPAPKAVPAPKAAPVAVAEPAAGGLGAKAVAPHRERHGAEFCNCGTEDEPVCGTDQQTYLNECVMTCAGAIKAKVRVALEPGGIGKNHGNLAAPLGAAAVYFMRHCICNAAWAHRHIALPAGNGCGACAVPPHPCGVCSAAPPAGGRPSTHHPFRPAPRKLARSSTACLPRTAVVACLLAGRPVRQGLLPAQQEVERRLVLQGRGLRQRHHLHEQCRGQGGLGWLHVGCI